MTATPLVMELASARSLVARSIYNPTVVGGALPRGSVSLVIYNVAAAGGSPKHANHGRVVTD